jgi:hypothetical protein
MKRGSNGYILMSKAKSICRVDDRRRREKMRLIDNLIGMQLVEWDDDTKILTVRNGEDFHRIEIDDSDCGGCCGYNEFFAELHVDCEKMGENPVITHAEACEDGDDCDKMVITFFGGAEKLISLHSESGSGSGWCYGACVKVRCKSLDMDGETITSW